MFFREHVPTQLKEIHHHPKLVSRLQFYANAWFSTPHLIFHGPNGSGKFTLISAFLRLIYGNAIGQVTVFQHAYFSVAVSPFHIVYTLSEKTSVSEVTSHIINRVQALNVINSSFHVVVIKCTSDLPISLMTSIRLILDQYTQTARFIFISSSLMQLQAVISRCLTIRVPKISFRNMMLLCASIPEYRSSEYLQDSTNLKLLYDRCRGNIFDTFLHIERKLQCKLELKKNIPFFDIDRLFDQLIFAIVSKNVHGIKSGLFQLLVIPYSASIIIKKICQKIQPLCDRSDFQKVIRRAANCEWQNISISNSLFALLLFCYSLAEYKIIGYPLKKKEEEQNNGDLQ